MPQQRLGSHFTVGNQYTRQDIYRLVAVQDSDQGGDWDTGYHRHGETFFVFCNVGVAGRTGHDYANAFDGDELVWWAKNRTRLAQPQIGELLHPGREVLVFYRHADRSPFTFAGRATPKEVHDAVDGKPVRVRWAFLDPAESHPERPPEEVLPGTTYAEGAVQQVLVNRYERNPAARAACIAHYGCRCAVCGFGFEAVYGELGRGFIHVHHVVPLATITRAYEMNPITDMIPVCPNCHAMLHRHADSVGVAALRDLVRPTERL